MIFLTNPNLKVLVEIIIKKGSDKGVLYVVYWFPSSNLSLSKQFKLRREIKKTIIDISRA